MYQVPISWSLRSGLYPVYKVLILSYTETLDFDQQEASPSHYGDKMNQVTISWILCLGLIDLLSWLFSATLNNVSVISKRPIPIAGR